VVTPTKPGSREACASRANPALFEKKKTEVEALYPNLHFHVVNDLVLVSGKRHASAGPHLSRRTFTVGGVTPGSQARAA
jgi:hypothetical protein